MQKKTILVMLAVATVMMLFPRNRVYATPAFVTTSTVRYACIISPDMYGHIEGEWVEDCQGNITGWGWEPGHNCTYTEVTYGASCGGGGGGPCPECGPDNRN